MTKDMIDLLKDDANIRKVTTTKYVETKTYYNNSEIMDTKEKEITAKEFNRLSTLSSISTNSHGSTDVETNYKKINLIITYGASISTKFVTLTNIWKTIPKIKSFDVMAIAPGAESISFNFSGHRSGYQKWDGNIVNYDINSKNWKIINSNTVWKKGLGLSQNLVDNTKTSLENSVTVTFVCKVNPFTAKASYQHAITDVTLAQSQNYTLKKGAMGDLIKFHSSVINKYDNTPGLEAESSLFQ